MTIENHALRDQLQAVEENLHEHIAYVQRQLPGMYVHDRDAFLLVDSGIASDIFNRICRARLAEADAGANIREAVSYFQRVERPFAWWVGPLSEPLDLGKRLEQAGLKARASSYGMVMEIPARSPLAPSDGVKIQRVSTRDEVLDFASVIASKSDPLDANVVEFFGRAASLILQDDSPMQLLVAYIDERAAAAAEVFLGGGVAGLHLVGTRTEFRGRGIGRAIVSEALAVGRKAGMSTAVIHASDETRPVYEALGFNVCCEFTEYE